MTRLKRLVYKEKDENYNVKGFYQMEKRTLKPLVPASDNEVQNKLMKKLKMENLM